MPEPAGRPRDEQTKSKDFTRSEPLQSKDKDFIIANFRTLWINAEKAQFFGVEQMQSALAGNKEFGTLNITIVANRSLADVVLEIGYTFAWDYPFSLKHENSGIILFSGKGSGAFSGPAGAAS